LFLFFSVTAIIAKAAQKYINAFCRDFDHDQLNLQLFKGDIVLENVVLNESVLQSLLNLPPSLRLESARAARLHINISWSRLKKQPVSISIGSLVVVLAEPPRTAPLPQNAPLPSFLRPPDVEKLKRKAREQAKAVASKDSKPANPKRRWIDALLENLRLVVEDIHIVVRTRGRPRERGGTDMTEPPLIHAHVRNITIDTADTDWRVADIAQLLAARKAAGDLPVIDVRKIIRIEAMSLAVGGATDEPGAVTLGSLGAAQVGSALFEERVVRVASVPLAVRLLLQRNAVSNKIIGLDFAMEIANFNVQFSLAQWKRAMWAIEGILWCLDRKKVRDADHDAAATSGASSKAATAAAAAAASSAASTTASPNAKEPRSAAKSAPASELELEPIALSESLRELDELNQDEDDTADSRTVNAERAAAQSEAIALDEPFGHVRWSFTLGNVLLELSENATNGWNCVANDLRIVLVSEKSRTDDEERRATRATQLSVQAAFAAVRDKRPGAAPIMTPQAGHRDAAHMIDVLLRIEVDAKDSWRKPAKLVFTGSLAPIVVVADRIGFNGLVAFVKSRLPVSPAKAAKAAKRAAAGKADEHDSDSDEDDEDKARRLKEKVTRRDRRKQQLQELREHLAPSASSIAPLAALDIRLNVGAFKLQVPGMRVGKREGATLELLIGGVSLRSLPLATTQADDISGSVRFQGRVIGFGVAMTGEQDDPACGDILTPFDVQLHVEQRHYVVVLRKLAAGGVQKGTMLADECRTEFSLTVAPIRIDLTPMQYATLLQAHVPVLDILARHRARARGRGKHRRRVERIQQRLDHGLLKMATIYFPFYMRFAMGRFRLRLIGFADEPFGYLKLLGDTMARVARLQRSAPLLPPILEVGFAAAEIVLQHREYNTLKGRAALEAPLARVRSEALLLPIELELMPTTGSGLSQVTNSQSSVTVTYDHVNDAEGAPHVVRMHAAGMAAQMREKGIVSLKPVKELLAELKKLTTKTAPRLVPREAAPEGEKHTLPRKVAFDLDAGDCEVRLLPWIPSAAAVTAGSSVTGKRAVAAANQAAANAAPGGDATHLVARDQLPLTAVPPAITLVLSPADRRQLAAAAARSAALVADATRSAEDSIRVVERREKQTKETLHDMEQHLIAAKVELAQVRSELSALTNDVSATKRREEEAHRRMLHVQQVNTELWALLETNKGSAAASNPLRSAMAKLSSSTSGSASSSTAISSSSGTVSPAAVRSYQGILQSMSESTLAAQNQAAAAERVTTQLEKQLGTVQARVEALAIERERLREAAARDIAEVEQRCSVLAEERDAARQTIDTREQQLLQQQLQFSQARDEIAALEQRVRELNEAERERAARDEARERRRKDRELQEHAEEAAAESKRTTASRSVSTVGSSIKTSKTEPAKVEPSKAEPKADVAPKKSADAAKASKNELLNAIDAAQSDSDDEKKSSIFRRASLRGKESAPAESVPSKKDKSETDKKEKKKSSEKSEKSEKGEKQKDDEKKDDEKKEKKDDEKKEKKEKKSLMTKLKEKAKKASSKAKKSSGSSGGGGGGGGADGADGAHDDDDETESGISDLIDEQDTDSE
jgi:hypothetical protein